MGSILRKIWCFLTDKEIYDKAWEQVVWVRVSCDVPGFDACVDAEFKRLKSILELNAKN